MSQEAINNNASFIFSIAELLRSDFKQSEYGKILLGHQFPFVVSIPSNARHLSKRVSFSSQVFSQSCARAVREFDFKDVNKNKLPITHSHIFCEAKSDQPSADQLADRPIKHAHRTVLPMSLCQPPNADRHCLRQSTTAITLRSDYPQKTIDLPTRH